MLKTLFPRDFGPFGTYFNTHPPTPLPLTQTRTHPPTHPPSPPPTHTHTHTHTQIRNVNVATDEGPSPKLALSESGSRGNIES